jgi:hypothetical protein
MVELIRHTVMVMKVNKTIFIIALTSALIFSVAGGLVNVYGEKCEDIKGTESWSSEGHGDNSPSESKFNKMLKDDSVSICELAEDIDHMKVKGSVDDWSDFKQTTVYMGSSENVQDCLKDRFDLPDDGHKELQSYEIQKCATGDY